MVVRSSIDSLVSVVLLQHLSAILLRMDREGKGVVSVAAVGRIFRMVGQKFPDARALFVEHPEVRLNQSLVGVCCDTLVESRFRTLLSICIAVILAGDPCTVRHSNL